VKLFVDLETLALIEGPGFRNPVGTLRFKRGDGARLEVAFLRNGTSPQSLGDPAGLSLQFGVKPRGRYDVGYLVQSTDWTLPAADAESPIYQCSPSFNTNELNAALQIDQPGQSELAEVLLMGEITWSQDGGEPTSTRTFLVIVENDVNRGDESAPQPLPDVEDWLDERALRHDQAQALSPAARNQARANAGAAADPRNLPGVQRHFPEIDPFATHYVLTADDISKRIVVPDGYLGGLSLHLATHDPDDEEIEIGLLGDVIAVDFQETSNAELSITRDGQPQLWVPPGVHYFQRSADGWSYIGNHYEATRFPASAMELESTNAALQSLHESAVKLTGTQTIAGQKTFTTAPRSTGTPDADTSLINRQQGDLRYGMQVVAIAATNLEKTSDTTLALDPELAVVLPSGRWMIEMVLVTSINLVAQINHTGTSITGSGGISIIARSSTGNVSLQGSSSGQYVNSTSGGNATNNGGAYFCFVHAHDAESTLTARWAQHTSSPTPTTRFAGSVLRATYLGSF
jgi:hypothetical protein